MGRLEIINIIGRYYLTKNIENDEYSYVKAAGSEENLIRALGYKPNHFMLDLRFESDDVVILCETKQNFKDKDQEQLKEYLAEEKALNPNKKIICILANTNNNKIRVWKSFIDDEHILENEKFIKTMEYYKELFELECENNREIVFKNTYGLNETLHKKDIDERLRSQFVGTIILYIRDILKKQNITQKSKTDEDTTTELRGYWSSLSAKQILSGIEETLENLLDEPNKNLKIKLLQRDVLENQKVKNLSVKDWIDILEEVTMKIYKYINLDSPEGQDILNLFFIAFNKYIGKADKNQAFTPDHITHFMCKITGVDRTKHVLDATCGSGSFLVQAMALEFKDSDKYCDKLGLEEDDKKKEKEKERKTISKENIYGIEIEEKAYGLAVTNMLIHGDGNSNIIFDSLFKSRDFIKKAEPDIILMNPPYNAKPKDIPVEYKINWGKSADGKEDPTKGLVFIKYISDVIKEMNEERIKLGKSRKEVKAAVLLPVSVAIGTSNIISDMKSSMLEDNTLEAVFTLPNEIFYPGASASACCMVFTLGKPHVNSDGFVPKTFFGYFKEDGHKKKKNLGRVEQFDKDNESIWEKIEKKWLELYRNKTVEDGLSAMQVVNGNDEWLCEAYMKTDYSKLTEADFQKTINNYLAYLVKNGKVFEDDET